MTETSTSSPPEAAVPPPHRETASNSWTIGDAEKVFRMLGEALADPACDSQTLLGAIAEAAHALSNGTAAALAMRRAGEVTCVGRSGENAPDLGARLSVDSGISGECLRTGRILRCDDTQKDYRVDPVVCLRLGLCSIAAVPLHHEQRVIGILEAFSNRPYAFAEEHMLALQKLAGLAERAYLRDPEVAVDNEPEPSKSAALLSRIQATATKARGVVSSRPWLYLAASAVIATVLGLAFVSWHSPTAATTAQASPVAAQPVALDRVGGATAGVGLTFDATSQADSAKPSPSFGMVQQAAKVEKEGSGDVSSQSATTPADLTPTVRETTDSTFVDQPPAIVASNDHSPLGNVLSSQTASLPRFTMPVSEGVTDGILTHKVQPVYPKQAVSLRLSGPVVLEGMINEEGEVQNLSVVSGNLTLAQAALDAVRQWRYKPYMLNGKAVAVKTVITIDFKAPQ